MRRTGVRRPGGLAVALGQFLLGAWLLIGTSWVVRTETSAFAYVGVGGGGGGSCSGISVMRFVLWDTSSANLIGDFDQEGHRACGCPRRDSYQ